MSRANVELVQKLYAAFGRGETAPIVAAATADAQWRVNGRNKDYPMIGTWRGPSGVQEFFKLLEQNEEFSEFTAQSFHGVDDKVFVLGRYTFRVKRTKRNVSSDWVHVFTLNAGKIVSFVEFSDTAQMAEAYRG